MVCTMVASKHDQQPHPGPYACGAGLRVYEDSLKLSEMKVAYKMQLYKRNDSLALSRCPPVKE